MRAFSRITLVAAAVTLTTAHPAPATAATGNSLYKWCTETTTIGKALCASYIAGVRDGIVADHIIGQRPTPFCIRDGVTIEQLVAVTKKFMDDNPSIRDQNAAAIIEFAFVGAFPCAK